jgi:hypothetical protein
MPLSTVTRFRDFSTAYIIKDKAIFLNVNRKTVGTWHKKDFGFVNWKEKHPDH